MPASEVAVVDNDAHSAVHVNKNAEVDIRRRLRLGRTATVDDALEILVGESQTQRCKGADEYERKLAQDPLEEMPAKAADSTGVSAGKQETASFRKRASILAALPSQIPPRYARKWIHIK